MLVVMLSQQATASASKYNCDKGTQQCMQKAVTYITKKDDLWWDLALLNKYKKTSCSEVSKQEV